MDFGFNRAIAQITRCADEAAFVHRLWFLIMNNEANGRNFHDGKYWTYDSLQALAKIFNFWTIRQLERIIRNCVKKGLIETGNFSENPFDRRTWYTVTETVKAIYANGEKDVPEPGNPEPQSGKSDLTKPGNLISPDGEMIKGAKKDLLEDQIEDERRAPENKRRKRVEPERQGYGEFGNVRLSEAELDKLCARWTAGQVGQAIEALSAYMRSKGKRYADHYATLLNWLKRDYPQGGQSLTVGEGWTNG